MSGRSARCMSGVAIRLMPGMSVLYISGMSVRCVAGMIVMSVRCISDMSVIGEDASLEVYDVMQISIFIITISSNEVFTWTRKYEREENH